MKFKKRFFVVALCLIVLAIYIIVGLNESPICRRYTVESEKINKDVKIVVLSDLHSMDREENNEIEDLVERENPDCIFYVGDMFDSSKPAYPTRKMMENLDKKYKSYYVTGNHETSVSRDEIVSEFSNLTYLKNDTVDVEINGNQISLSGIDDYYKNEKVWFDNLQKCAKEKDDSRYRILLSHRPEFAEEYEKLGFDLSVCGHTHGGQVRIPPLANGLFVPGQGWFPEYVGGGYTLGNGKMIVSRGLIINHRRRIYNPAEVVVINLKSK